VCGNRQRLFAEELALYFRRLSSCPADPWPTQPKFEILPNKDVGACIASGSYEVDAMMVIPARWCNWHHREWHKRRFDCAGADVSLKRDAIGAVHSRHAIQRIHLEICCERSSGSSYHSAIPRFMISRNDR